MASFNLHNWFTTLGERGADDAEQLERQRRKLIAAIRGFDADIVGLVELENALALEALVAALDADADADAGSSWVPVADPAGGLAESAIRVGMIYRPRAVRPVGAAVTDLDPVFRRSPLGQTFEVSGEGAAGRERFSVVVHHFKSKGCRDAEGAELDQDDGQGCWNPLRTRQAERALELVARLQAESGDPDVLMIGDLNAYGDEDPLRALSAGGLVDQMAVHVPIDDRYTYVYKGNAGVLDHALATASLAGRVAGVAVWHINADEPSALDYTAPLALYRPDPFRSSDHDPVLIGLDF